MKASFYFIMFAGKHDGKVVFAKFSAYKFVSSTGSLTPWEPNVMGCVSNSCNGEVLLSPMVPATKSFNVCIDRIC